MEDAITVLVVEDDPITAMEIVYVLRQAGYRVVGPAHTVSQATDLLASTRVDFAVLDVHLGRGQSGLDLAEIIHRQYQIPYIFLTAFSDPQTLAVAQEQAPFGYLVKPFQAPTLLSTTAVALSNYRRLSQGIDFSQFSVRLTAQEEKLCQVLIQGLSYQQMADELNVSINTVRYHLKNLYLKFEVNSRAELVNKLISP